MSILFTFIIGWAICIALAGIAYIIFKAFGHVSSGFCSKLPKMPKMFNTSKWRESDLVNKWNALPMKHKIIVILVAITPMAGAVMYSTIKQQRRTQ